MRTESQISKISSRNNDLEIELNGNIILEEEKKIYFEGLENVSFSEYQKEENTKNEFLSDNMGLFDAEESFMTSKKSFPVRNKLKVYDNNSILETNIVMNYKIGLDLMDILVDEKNKSITKKAMHIIEKQLRQKKSNSLNIIKQQFVDQFINEYQNQIEKFSYCSEVKKSNSSLKEKMYNDLDDFLNIFTKFCGKFYDFKNILYTNTKKKVAHQKLRAFILNELFDDKKLYTTVFEVFRLANLERNTKINQFLTKYKHISAETMGIPKAFRLEESLEKSLGKYDNLTSISKSNYSLAVANFKNIEISWSPLHKFKCFIRCFELTKKCIEDHFYRNSIKLSSLVLSQTNFLKIIFFLLANAHIENFLIHYEFASIFCQQYMKEKKYEDIKYIKYFFEFIESHFDKCEEREFNIIVSFESFFNKN